MAEKRADLKDLKNELWLRLREEGLIRWETSNGDKIPINQMSDAHLVNAISMLLNKAKKQTEQKEEYYNLLDTCGMGDSDIIF